MAWSQVDDERSWCETAPNFLASPIARPSLRPCMRNEVGKVTWNYEARAASPLWKAEVFAILNLCHSRSPIWVIFARPALRRASPLVLTEQMLHSSTLDAKGEPNGAAQSSIAACASSKRTSRLYDELLLRCRSRRLRSASLPHLVRERGCGVALRLAWLRGRSVSDRFKLSKSDACHKGQSMKSLKSVRNPRSALPSSGQQPPMTSGHGAENCDQAYDKQDAMHPFDQSESSLGV